MRKALDLNQMVWKIAKEIAKVAESQAVSVSLLAAFTAWESTTLDAFV